MIVQTTIRLSCLSMMGSMTLRLLLFTLPKFFVSSALVGFDSEEPILNDIKNSDVTQNYTNIDESIENCIENCL